MGKEVKMPRECKSNAVGSFRTTQAGKIEYRVPYYDEFGKRRVKSFTAETEEDCLERADDFWFRLEQKLVGIDISATIPDILKNKAEQDFRMNYTGEQGYDRRLKTIAIIEKSMIGNMPIAELQEYHLEAFMQSITRYSNTVISKIFSMLRSAFKIAHAKNIVTKNLMDLREFRCPRSNKPDKKIKALTENEQKKFIETLEEYKGEYGTNTYKNQLLIELYSGLRMGEINALKPEDINLKKGFIHVAATVSRGLNSRNFIKIGAKTKTGVRDVPISKQLRPIIERALDERKENPEGVVFYDYYKNDVIATYQVNSFYMRICKKAGIESNGQHSLRHTFATRCIEAGIPPVVLKKWLGHTNIHITLDTYADVFDRMNFGAIAKFESFIDDVMKR